jgi:hypothetical protein
VGDVISFGYGEESWSRPV